MVECEYGIYLMEEDGSTGFNRYMVECECLPIKPSGRGSDSFNRYMVECELKKTMAESKGLGVLIDTWWNVNEPDIGLLSTFEEF